MTLKCIFEDHFSLGCHFHVHFSHLWQAFASRGFPAIAELLVSYAGIDISNKFNEMSNFARDVGSYREKKD